MRHASTALAALLLSLAACSEEAAPARPAPAKPPAATPAADAGGEAAPVAAAYTYSPVGKRDPFRTFFDNFAAAEPASQSDADCGPLCQWELDQLRLVAVVSGVASPLAMLEDPEGRGHMIRRGSQVGKRSGKVSEIRRDRIVVTELLRSQQGQIIPAKSEIFLRSKDGKDRVGNEIVDLSMQ